MREIIKRTQAFSDIEPVSYSHALAGLGRAAYTLFVTPKHEKLHQIVEDLNCSRPPQPLHPSINETTRRIQEKILPQIEAAVPLADGAQLIHLGGVLIQFGDYVPEQHTTIKVPYENIHGLHRAVTHRAQDVGPLDYAEQLDVALKQTDGNMMESLWQLFITSRFYARWLDSKLVKDMPEYTQEEKVALMLEWRESIAACKEPLPDRAQDPNGDTYYTWTHALGKAALVLTPAKETAVTRRAAHIFEHGTDIMHKVVHTINKQAVQSDHSIASAYGNAIGQALVNTIRR